MGYMSIPPVSLQLSFSPTVLGHISGLVLVEASIEMESVESFAIEILVDVDRYPSTIFTSTSRHRTELKCRYY